MQSITLLLSTKEKKKTLHTFHYIILVWMPSLFSDKPLHWSVFLFLWFAFVSALRKLELFSVSEKLFLQCLSLDVGLAVV